MIQPSPSAPVGSVTSLGKYSPSDFLPSSAVLCRNAAPLIAFAFALMRRNVGCRVLGREIGTSLITLIDRARASSIEELEQNLEKMRSREMQKAIDRGNDSAIATIEDKYDCLALFVEHESSIDAVKDRIKNLFSDSDRGLLTLATVHKSKGLEWHTVFILDRDLMPSKYAKQQWQKEQERHLQYVAVTRAKENLIYILSDQWKPKTEEKTPEVAESDIDSALNPPPTNDPLPF